MTEPTKEQVEKWRSEAILFLSGQTLKEWENESKNHNIAVPLNEWIDDHVCGNAEIDRVSTYVAAKKSNFEEIESLKDKSQCQDRIVNSLIRERKQIAKNLRNEIKTLKEQLAKSESILKTGLSDSGVEGYIDFKIGVNEYFSEKQNQNKEKKDEK